MKKEISFEKNYLTVADVKSYLCISTTAAYDLTHRKDFPVCRLGTSIRIPTPAVSGLGGKAHPGSG